ncbi:MAG: Uma2 family endonuclease [Firmicutes bacterium]|nr:Uma2 family endonuclease [Bacillota bacterium]
MLTIQDMKYIKDLYGYSYAYIAEKTGVPLATVQKVLAGKTTSPRRETLAALSAFFVEHSKVAERLPGLREPGEDLSEMVLQEEDTPFRGNLAKKIEPPEFFEDWDPGRKIYHHYTIRDYENLPDDVRVELIDGVFYLMSAPSFDHQDILMYIGMEMYSFVGKNKGKCKVMVAPLDVQLDKDIWTMVQPDILVVCDPSIITQKRMEGAPDLIVEILSPSNRRKDVSLKLYKYIKAGVKEYWIVDPVKRITTVYRPGDQDFYRIYPFKEPIPVGIWEGKCQIDLSEVELWEDTAQPEEQK